MKIKEKMVLLLGSLKIVNVVATSDLGQKIDLIKLLEFEYVIYNQEKYGGRVAYYQTPNMFGKTSIFASGKMISIGTKSLEQATSDLKITVNFLTEKGFIEYIEILVHMRNIVALLSEPFKIDLESLQHDVRSVYEPEQFPGLILRYNDPKVTFLIFASGKIVISGSKNYSELYIAKDEIHNIVEKYSY